jgi:acyl-coenzyme A synthetase/AMP-(fatty) acid ligase
VEPGEIETVIGQHTDIRKAAVVVRTLPTGDKQLVAYFVPASKVKK